MRFDKKLVRRIRSGVLLLGSRGCPAPVYDLRDFPISTLAQGHLQDGHEKCGERLHRLISRGRRFYVMVRRGEKNGFHGPGAWVFGDRPARPSQGHATWEMVDRLLAISHCRVSGLTHCVPRL